MASLALAASLVVLFTIFIGPLTYLIARLNFPSFLVYLLSTISIVNGFWFACIGLPVWYIGLIPIYFAYISIQRVRQKKNQG